MSEGVAKVQDLSEFALFEIFADNLCFNVNALRDELCAMSSGGGYICRRI